MKYLYLLIISFNLLSAQNYTFQDKIYYLEKFNDNIYIDENNKKVKIKNNFFVKLKLTKNIQTLLNNYNVQIAKKYSNQLYLLKSDAKNILDLIEQINNDINTIYAYPNFYKKLEAR
jgi:hypothetical protein